MFIQVLIDETDLCIGFKELEPLNGIGSNFSKTVNKVAKDVSDWLFDGECAIYHQMHLKVSKSDIKFC